MDANDIKFLDKLGANVCLSGGAAGADVTWGSVAEKVGHTVVHWSFDGHKPSTKENIYKLSEEELKEADTYLVEANKFLKRRLPFHKPWIINLLRRNWYQIKYADSVYAIGTLNNKAVIYEPDQYGKFYPNQWNKYDTVAKDDYIDRMGVDGGTAWACQLYFSRWLEEVKTFEGDEYAANPSLWFPPFQLIFYDQEKRKVLSWAPAGRYWAEIDIVLPQPSGVYAAIGTRKLNESGKAFIKEIFNR